MNVIFDMDGLMFDTERVFIAAWDYAGEKIGIGKAGYMVYKTLGMNIAASYNVWKEEFGDSYDQDGLKRYTKEFLQKYYTENKVPVKKGLYNLLDYLKQNNCKMAVASSSPRWEVEKHLKDANIYEYFIGIVCGDMIQESKPDPEIYLKACELLEVSPSECYALEDSRNGLLSAHRAGCRPIMVPDLWQPDDEILKVIVGKYNDLDEVKAAFECQRSKAQLDDNIADKDILEKFEFRNIRQDEAEQAVAIEQICFPPNEACSEQNMKERIETAPELFLVAVDKETGRLAGFLNGLATDEYAFRDEFFTDASLYNPNGRNVMLLGLDVLPEYRRQGLGRELVFQYLRRERKKNRHTIFLTCLKSKVKMYKKFGFTDCGIADSTWGGEEWHEMRCTLVIG